MARLPAPKTWEQYRDGVLAWLQDQWGPERKCPYCNNPGWSIGPVVYASRTPRWPDQGLGPDVAFPYAQVHCTKCGHTVHVHALWIFEPQEPADDPSS
jgi:DNA-directed RNA polymerase subunit RPC12/RpoP